MEKENKSYKFRRLAKARGEIVVKYIQLLGNLSNTNNYDYTSEEITKVFAIIDDELKRTKSRFHKKIKREINF